jgi:UDP-N-acetylglucosamine diphosphorylase / glucose-1-phosphate thymidylyltransferase / UDP-N-acetylgalactosamine diphosphorylase / glucosamine-1-phosphate N-acetyltransferase / galactosamine-1-phosphate N-acetyltransferase
MIRKAIVPAAGRGARMGGLTRETPKPMLLVEGRPMLEHIVLRLRDAGARHALIVTGFMGETIEAHFHGWEGVSFVRQQVADGTAAAALLGRDFADRDPFILTFGDILCAAENYSGIGAVLEETKAAAVVGVKYVDDPWQGAAVYADASGALTRIVEKPPRGGSATHWNSAGLYAFAPEMFDEMAAVPKSERGEYEITAAIARAIEHGRAVRMFEMRGAWRDVGRPDDLNQAAAVLRDSGPRDSG